MATDEKKIVGYCRTYLDGFTDTVQERMIRDYCKVRDIECDMIYTDQGYSKRHRDEIWRAERLGLKTERHRHVYHGWENMLIEVINGHVGTILVDHYIRLYSGEEQKQVFEQICAQYGVRVIEVSAYEISCEARGLNIAIFHFSSNAELRPAIATNVVDGLYQYASQLKDWGAVHLYLDFSLVRNKQMNYYRMIQNVGKYDVILVRNFYHLSKKTMQVWKMAEVFIAQGVRVISMEEGEIYLNRDQTILKKSLKIALYDNARTKYELDIQDILIERMTAFKESKASSWEIHGVYIDDFRSSGQLKLNQLIDNRADYDLVVVDSFSKINEITNIFTKIKARLQIPIYSIKEAVLYEQRKDIV